VVAHHSLSGHSWGGSFSRTKNLGLDICDLRFDKNPDDDPNLKNGLEFLTEYDYKRSPFKILPRIKQPEAKLFTDQRTNILPKPKQTCSARSNQKPTSILQTHPVWGTNLYFIPLQDSWDLKTSGLEIPEPIRYFKSRNGY